MIEPLAKRVELRFHSVLTVLASDNNFQGEQTAVKCGEAVPHVLAAQLTTLCEVM